MGCIISSIISTLLFCKNTKSLITQKRKEIRTLSAQLWEFQNVFWIRSIYLCNFRIRPNFVGGVRTKCTSSAKSWNNGHELRKYFKIMSLWAVLSLVSYQLYSFKNTKSLITQKLKEIRTLSAVGEFRNAFRIRSIYWYTFRLRTIFSYWVSTKYTSSAKSYLKTPQKQVIALHVVPCS